MTATSREAEAIALRVVGAGLGRTGTASLKLALEALLGGRCYHMLEAASRPRDVELWRAAVRGGRVDWPALLGDYAASVDWPACAFWRELAAANPGALVLLSSRESPERWWASMERTIVPTVRQTVAPEQEELARHRAMVRELLERRFTPRWQDREEAIAAYERHNEDVRRSVEPERLLEWRPGDGWEPLCTALGVAVPAEPFPHENTTEDFRARQGLDER
jgi:Sulfotransferase domain